jgi:hypothetical protein
MTRVLLICIGIFFFAGCLAGPDCRVDVADFAGDIGEDGSQTSPDRVWELIDEDGLLTTYWPGPRVEAVLPDNTTSVEVLADGYDTATGSSFVGVTLFLTGTDPKTHELVVLDGPVTTGGPYPPESQAFTLYSLPGTWDDMSLVVRATGSPGQRKLLQATANTCAK